MRRAGRAGRTPRTFCCDTAPTPPLERRGAAGGCAAASAAGPADAEAEREEAPRAGAGAERSRRRRRQKFGFSRSCGRKLFFFFFPSLPGGGGGGATAGANASGLGVGAARTGGGGLAPRGEARPGGPEGGSEDRGLRVRRRRRVCPAQGRAPARLPARLRGGGGGGAGGCTWWQGAGGWPAAGTSWSRCWGCCCCWRAPAPGRWSACPATSPSAKSLGAAPGASSRASAAAATCAPARGTRAAAAPTGSTEPAIGGCAVSSAPRSMATPSPSTKWASAKVRPPPRAPSHLARAAPSALAAPNKVWPRLSRGERAPREKGLVAGPGREPRVPPFPRTASASLPPPDPFELASCRRGWISWVGVGEWGSTPGPSQICKRVAIRAWVGWLGPAPRGVGAAGRGHCRGCR